MRIAIFIAQADSSELARALPDDGQEFSALIRAARPGWTVDVHRVALGDFPDTLDADAGLITGSIASVHDEAPWIRRLEGIIREFATARRPLYGACFGHQLIAHALGGRVEPVPEGWQFGLIETMHADCPGWMMPAKTLTLLHGAYREHVARLPDDAIALGTSPGCSVAAMGLGHHIATTQHLPALTRKALLGLVPLLRGQVDDAQIEAARTEQRQDDNDLYARWIARFFEAGQT